MGDTYKSTSSQDIGGLNELRATLAKRIHQARTSSDVQRRDYDQLNPLEIQYNAVVNQICSILRGPLSDPLEVLPEEIWEKIVYETARPSAGHWSAEHIRVRIEEILLLTLVSTRWRNAIINNPRFWNTIELIGGLEDAEARIHLAITLSQDFPLAFVCGSGWEKFAHYIINQSFRIRSLVLPPFDDIDVILSSIDKVPLLENLHLSRSHMKHSKLVSFIRTAKSIRSITGTMALSLEILTSSSITRIRRLDIVDSSQEYLPFIESLKYLEYVKYYFDGRVAPYLLKNGSSPLPWKHLTFSGKVIGYGEHLFKRIASTIVQLEVFLTFWDTSDFLLHCSNMPLLRSLELLLSNRFQGGTHNAIRPLDLPSTTIQDLHINMFPYKPSPVSKESIDILFENLASLAPNVQRLMCRGAPQSFAPFHVYVTSLKRLQSVEILFERDAPSDELERTGGVLSTQKLILRNWKYLKTFRTSGVLNLNVQIGNEEPDLPGILKHSEWRNLRVIQFPEWAGNWEGVSLPHVTKISFYYGFNATKISCGISSLCQEIAVHPEIFPSLEKLGFDIPEWDILFLMLEQRNMSTSAKVARIKSVELAPLPSITILQPLTELLGGRITIRPTNYEISLAGIARVYFEPKLHGCIRCTRVFKPCQAKRSEKISVFLLEQQFIYPDSPEKILSTRVERVKQWDTIFNTPELIGKVQPCTSFPDYRRVEVTEHSLDGVSFDEI